MRQKPCLICKTWSNLKFALESICCHSRLVFRWPLLCILFKKRSILAMCSLTPTSFNTYSAINNFLFPLTTALWIFLSIKIFFSSSQLCRTFLIITVSHSGTESKKLPPIIVKRSLTSISKRFFLLVQQPEINRIEFQLVVDISLE